MKIYNVWICVEEIGDNYDNGKDIEVRKVAMFKKEEDAVNLAIQLEKENDTPRDEWGFTI